jgi:hypothetical protein
MKVFISYAREDWEIAEKVWRDLKRAGIDAWIDRKELLPGQNLKKEISRAIRASSHFIALLSARSVSKQGFFQTELKKAIDVPDTFPEHRIYFIPVFLQIFSELLNRHLTIIKNLVHKTCSDSFTRMDRHNCRAAIKYAEDSDDCPLCGSLRNRLFSVPK